jgi:hypothetical protein
VQKVPDAAIPDAYAPDSPNMLTCGAGEMVCNNTCANLMTSELYCGNCNTQCSPTQGCLNGTCVPANTSCMRVRELDPAAPDGLYRNPNNDAIFFCDFTNTRTIDGVFMGQFDATYSGYNLVKFEELSTEQYQQAFIAFYNRQGGLPLLANWVSGNCCYATTGGMILHFGGSILYPSTGSSFSCNPVSPGYTGGPWRPYHVSTSAVLNPPLPQNYFTTNAVTQDNQCTVAQNPGFFWRARNNLN